MLKHIRKYIPTNLHRYIKRYTYAAMQGYMFTHLESINAYIYPEFILFFKLEKYSNIQYNIKIRGHVTVIKSNL